MTQPLAVVNETEAFLAGFSGKFLIRLLHRGYDEATKQPERLKPRQFYISQGELADLLPTLHGLNDGRSPDHQFNVFMCVNDPGGLYAGKSSIYEMRAIYQDADVEATALIEPEIAGQRAHIVLQTSPGKRQRFWHTASIEPHRQPSIHEQMVARHHHDPSTEGPQRLVRMPGFLNWKKDYLPNGVPVSIVWPISGLPPLTREQVFKHFGQREHGDLGDPNLASGNANIQQSGDLPKGSNVAVLKDHPKWGARDRQVDAEHRRAAAHETPSHTLRTDDLLIALSAIDPDTHRNEWRRVLAALHYMAGGREWGKDIAERWSAMALYRFDAKGFEGHWAGLSNEVAHPAHWGTLQNMTAQAKHDDDARARLQSTSFAEFQVEHGPFLDYEIQQVDYPDIEEREDTRLKIVRLHSKINMRTLHQACGYQVYYDMFQQEIMVESSEDKEPKPISKQHHTQLYSMGLDTKYRVSLQMIRDLTGALAQDRKRDPVVEYFNKLAPWDGVKRLDTVFQDHLGAPDRPSIRETFTLMMCAMVRRSFVDRVKFDLMPIMEGKQAAGKSKVFEVLMPDKDWFGTGPKLSEEDKRLYPALRGKLVIEFAELAGHRKTDVETIKRLVSQGVDECTENYATAKTRAPRRCVFIGTTNERRYLRDLTGNRRHPIIPVSGELNIPKFIAVRDQLWAEALVREKEVGDLRLSPEAEADMVLLQEDRRDIDSEALAALESLRAFKEGFISTDTLWEHLDLSHNDRSKRTAHHKMAMKQLRDSLELEGWEYTPYWNGSKTIRAHVKRNQTKRGALPEITFNGREFTSTGTDDIEDILK